ncbi:hypothetical protein LTR85_003957 [Meristemomyces frigidus]|nr:hypothetical protein LTR85_003957 [Meristemomyces frigidus]
MNTQYQPPQGLVTENELLHTPMEECHKELAIMHFRRLTRILAEEDEDAIGRYTSKDAVREQIARMSLVVRDYMAEHAKGNIADDAIESMIADIVDASFFLSGKQGTFSQPTFVNPLFLGREHEIAALMQEVSAGNVDDVIELWNAPPSRYGSKVLPEHGPGWDIGSEVDWNRVLGRSRSEDDITHHFRHTKIGNATGAQRIQKKLMKHVQSRIVLAWPPAPHEYSTVPSRGRSRANTGSSQRSTSFWSWDYVNAR